MKIFILTILLILNLVSKVLFKNETKLQLKKGDIFDRMRSIATYFKKYADSNPAFKPEFEVSELINLKINKLTELTKADVEQMISKINDTEDHDHYNGSSWLDYKMHFSALMKVNGFEIASNEKMEINSG